MNRIKIAVLLLFSGLFPNMEALASKLRLCIDYEYQLFLDDNLTSPFMSYRFKIKDLDERKGSDIYQEISFRSDVSEETQKDFMPKAVHGTCSRNQRYSLDVYARRFGGLAISGLKNETDWTCYRLSLKSVLKNNNQYNAFSSLTLSLSARSRTSPSAPYTEISSKRIFPKDCAPKYDDDIESFLNLISD